VQVEEEHKAYVAAVSVGPKCPPGSEVDLGMRVVLVHGDDVIADSQADGSLQAACAKFKQWVRKTFFNE
jgi:hypothetical protein